jgi:hypothetical protein
MVLRRMIFPFVLFIGSCVGSIVAQQIPMEKLKGLHPRPIAVLMGALPEPEGQGIRSNTELLPGRVGRASAYLRSSWEAPNCTETRVLVSAEDRVRGFLVRVNAFISGGWSEYRKKVEEAHLSLFPETPPLELILER